MARSGALIRLPSLATAVGTVAAGIMEVVLVSKLVVTGPLEVELLLRLPEPGLLQMQEQTVTKRWVRGRSFLRAVFHAQVQSAVLCLETTNYTR